MAATTPMLFDTDHQLSAETEAHLVDLQRGGG
jgi:hypothetical protein